MPNQCTKCGKVYADAAEELLKGCTCNSRFFYYIRQEKFDDLENEMQKVMIELDKADKDQIEKDIRELTGLDKKPDEPVILDLESVRVIKPGKFEIDIVSLFSKNRPLIYKLGEGKYIIDIVSSLETKETKDKIKHQVDVLEIPEPKEEEKPEEIKKTEEQKQATEAQTPKSENLSDTRKESEQENNQLKE